MKPIEAGCTAIIVKSDIAPELNVGKQVKVIGLIQGGPHPFSMKLLNPFTNAPENINGKFTCRAERTWVIAGDLKLMTVKNKSGVAIPAYADLTIGDLVGNGVISEQSLMRIDGFDEDIDSLEKEKDLSLVG